MSSVDLKNSNALVEQLLQKYQPGAERGGLVLDDGTVVELANICDKPEQGYTPNLDELIPHLPRMVATWHTHPDATANLSVEDWETFVQWPEQVHAIVGNDGLRWYRIARNAVINA
jgi:proteasome lid subunit RPN8/RPN11